MKEKKCWICGNIADTGEHKIKKSILKDLYSEDFKNHDMLHYKDGKFNKLQGANSNKIKYTNSLCSHCNNTFTQPFDRAYDTFVKYIQENSKNIEKLRYIDFHYVYGEDFGNKQTNLFKYFTKILGCDLYEYDFSVPDDLVELLTRDLFQTKLTISLSINEKILEFHNHKTIGYGIGLLTTSMENLNTKKEIDTWYQFELKLGYISVNMFYNKYSDIGLGSEWIANKQYIYLGSSNDESFSKTCRLYVLKTKK